MGWQGLPSWFFCAVQPPLAWRVALSRFNQLRSPCKPVRCAPKMLQFTHVPPSHTYAPFPKDHRGHHYDRRLSPPTPPSASPGLASLSTRLVAALDGLVKHGLAGGGQWQRHLVVGVVVVVDSAAATDTAAEFSM